MKSLPFWPLSRPAEKIFPVANRGNWPCKIEHFAVQAFYMELNFVAAWYSQFGVRIRNIHEPKISL